MDIRQMAEQYFQDTVEIRRDLHRHPELSDQIVRTSNLVAASLDAWGIPYRRIEQQGILGIIDSDKPGKTVALRADMDGLPIQERSDQEYCSIVEGAAHLCGHDCHTASLLTAARILKEKKDSFSGKVYLIFQPCEEAAKGVNARAMIQNGAMQGVDAVFGLHMYNNIDAGRVSVQPGVRMAASIRGKIVIHGEGSHAGSPHQGIDAIVAASAVVMNLQSIVSRELNAQDPAVITVGTISGGSSQFAVCDCVELGISVKFFNTDLTDKICKAISRIATKTAEAYRASCDVILEGFMRAVVNDETLAQIALMSARKLFGQECVAVCPPWCASEDFGEYEKFTPGIFALVGGRNESAGLNKQAHNPSFDIDERGLAVATAMYAQFAIDYLNQ